MTRSFTEAGYKALADSTFEIIWLQYLLLDLQVFLFVPTIWCDNIGVICLSNISFMLVLSMLRLIIILYVTELLQRPFKLTLFLSMISLQTFLQNFSPLLFYYS
jgi:hypothetical protein